MTRGRDKFQQFRPVISFLVSVCSLFPRRMRMGLFEHCRMATGYKGLVLRYALLKTLAGSCGDNISIHPGVYILNVRNVSIGDNVSIHPMCYIDGAGGVEIGNDVSIAHGVSIMSSTHQYTLPGVKIKDQPLMLRRTVIEDDVWIGARALILAGVVLQKRCIVGGGAVVTRDVSSNTIVAGVPAEKIKEF